MRLFHALALAGAVSASVILSAAAPAVADQGMNGPFAKPSTAQHYIVHASRRSIGRAYPATRVAAIPAAVVCDSYWCRRDFVLMLGIGF